MIITLNYRAPLGLPSGVTLQPGVPTVVHGWDGDKKSKVVQAWIKSSILKVGTGRESKFVSAAPTEDDTNSGEQNKPEATPATKEELIAALAQKGITADKRKSVKQLQEMLAGASD